MNRVELIGNATADPKIFETKNGNMAVLSVATNERFKNAEGEKVEVTEYHNVVIFNKYLIKIAENIVKGDRLFVMGKLKHSKYTNAEGNDIYKTDVVVDLNGEISIIKKIKKEEENKEVEVKNMDDMSNYF